MLSFKPALALCALGAGSATFGTAVYFSTYQTPSPAAVALVPSPTATSTDVSETQADATNMPNIVDLEPVTILGVLSHGVPTRPRETRLEPCSVWRELAGGPRDRAVRDLCEVTVACDGVGCISKTQNK